MGSDTAGFGGSRRDPPGNGDRTTVVDRPATGKVTLHLIGGGADTKTRTG